MRYAPLAFSEQGVAMLSTVLSSEHAIRVNIQIIRIFTKMRALLSSQKEILQKLEQLEKKELEQDEKIVLIFKYLKQLEKTKQDEIEFKNRKRVGFEQKKGLHEKGEETPLKTGDFALVNPDEKHQYRNKGDVPFKMICGVPKEFE